MKIQQKKERELAAREGTSKTTLIYGTWLLISMGLGYAFFSYLERSGTMTMRALRSQLRLPSSVPEWLVMAGCIFVFVMAAQAALSFGFLLANPEGRRRAGKGNLRSNYHDYRDNQ